jgi:tetratricopeptide (TPR) repeat protein
MRETNLFGRSRLLHGLGAMALACWGLLQWAAVCAAADFGGVQPLLDQGKFTEAIGILLKETDENPAHEAARMMLAEAYEKAGQTDKAMVAWADVVALSRNDENLRKARRALARLRRAERDAQDAAATGRTDAEDPFKIPNMPQIDWEGLEKVEDSKYLPPIFPPPRAFEVPPFVYETPHFTVYSPNERLSKVVGDRAEIYLEFMVEKLFRGRSWAVRIPILVYSTVEDYVEHGGPQGTGGVTLGHLTGKTEAILLFQLKPDFSRNRESGGQRGGGGRSRGSDIWKYGIESVLPHELTHAVINEFFGGQETPQWLHEAVAGRFEQTRKHYSEAARLARQVVAGEFFRMRDLFDQKGYPERIELFYEQAAVVVLYLFEAGPDAMYSFLSELAAGNSHDAACAAALGIPERGAVEEFERRWVDWMRRRYLRDLDRSVDDTQTANAEKSTHAAFLPWVNELDTVDKAGGWRNFELASMQQFRVPTGYKSGWSNQDGVLRSSAGDEGRTLLAMRMNEAAPVAITCEARFLGSPGDARRSFGFAQLDANGFDTRVETLAAFRDNTSHKVVCIWSDDLALYVDDVCIGRYPALHAAEPRDVDYPLALVANGPFEIQNLRITHLDDFSDKPIVAPAERTDSRRSEPTRRPPRERRPRRDEKKDP